MTLYPIIKTLDYLKNSLGNRFRGSFFNQPTAMVDFKKPVPYP